MQNSSSAMTSSSLPLNYEIVILFIDGVQLNAFILDQDEFLGFRVGKVAIKHLHYGGGGLESQIVQFHKGCIIIRESILSCITIVVISHLTPQNYISNLIILSYFKCFPFEKFYACAEF